MPENIGLAARDSIFIGDTDDSERKVHASLEQHGGTGLAEPSVNGMLLGGNDGAALASSREKCIPVERLDGVHAYHAAGESFFLTKPGGSEQTMYNGFAGGDEGDIRAGADLDCFAEGEFCFRPLQGEHRRFAETDVYGAFRFGRFQDCVT